MIAVYTYTRIRACFIPLYYFINPNIPFNVSIPNYLKQRKIARAYTRMHTSVNGNHTRTNAHVAEFIDQRIICVDLSWLPLERTRS